MSISIDSLNDCLINHKIKHSFNERKEGVPDIFFLLERHRPGYDRRSDIKHNDAVVDRFYTENSVAYFEKPAGEKIDQTTYLRTKDWTVPRKIEGCFNPQHLKATEQAYNLLFGLDQIDSEVVQGESDVMELACLSVQLLYDRIVYGATPHHAKTIIDIINGFEGPGPIFFVIGKDHASFPKNKSFAPECRDSVQKIHDFLQAHGKWSVILVPKKPE